MTTIRGKLKVGTEVEANRSCSPGISIVIPCHNDGEYLTRSAKSVLEQEANGLPGFELLIIDDGSEDANTQSILQEISLLDDRVRILHRKTAGGVASARNYGVENAVGTWVAFLDADDEWLPTALQDRWALVARYPDAEWIGADHVLFWDNGEMEDEGFLASRERPRQCLKEAFEKGQPVVLKRPVVEFLETMPAWTGTVFVKKSVFELVGGFDSHFKQAEDNHLWLRLAAYTDYIFLPKVIARYRQRNGSLTSTSDSSYFWDYKMLLDLKKQAQFSDYKSNIRQRILSDLKNDVWFQRGIKKWSKALRSSLIACCVAPLRPKSYRLFLSTFLAGMTKMFHGT
ncbi:MAG TPA: glycosyltransferase [Gammaproteobacteria bacterium]|nr:glycosyltransferase [Gammaproteobacteria bacterium]